MNRSQPKVTIGLPVYNGAKFLRETLDSLLSQTFVDMELVVSDNASTDETEAICLDRAARDPRVRYYRSPQNRGAAWNYNRVVELAKGEYFKWAAHDDLLAPTFLEQCVELLDQNPEVVLCHSHCGEIDEDGKHKPHAYNDAMSRLDATRNPAEAFACVLRSRYAWIRVFGVIRLDVLRTTRQIGPFVGSDWLLMSELALRGPMAEVPEELFLRRFHPETSVQACRERRKRLAWFDGVGKRVTCLPEWRLFAEYFCLVLWRAPATWRTRAIALAHLARKAAGRWRALVLDLNWAMQDISRQVAGKIWSPLAAPRPQGVSELKACKLRPIDENSPRVSVLMTVYNGEQYLAESIRSVLDQTLTDLELIVVDDGSEDGSREVLRQLENDPRLRVLDSPHIGRVAALNLALQTARAEYVAILDADDVALPDRLQQQVDYLERHPQVGLLGTACRVMDETTGRQWVRRHALDNDSLREALVRENSFIHSAVMMPRAVLEEVGGYRERFQKCHDYELYVRIGRRYAMANLPDVLLIKRVHHGAAFRFRFSTWRAYRERMMARWQAWCSFSRAAKDLPYVAEPLLRYFKTTLKNLAQRGKLHDSKAS